jgi:cell division protein FtsN
MAQDFAKGKKRRRKTTATRRSSKKEVSGRPVWFVAGLLCGLFLAFLYSLATSNSDTATSKSKAVTPEKKEQPAEKPAAKPKPKFEFYDMLPESEVEVSTDSLPAQKTQRFLYIMQAGSFTDPDDADRRRAEILLLGLQARIEESKTGDRSTRYRVYVGPFEDRGSMNKARGMLSNNAIETLLLKRKAQ